MFSKELESLIQATLEDGKLEDFEKAALAKRAQAEGVDLAELEIYINSLLQRRARELNQKREEELNMLSKQKKEAFGRVCPNCGAQVKAMTLRCDCGYEFTKAKAVSSVNLLYDKLNSVTRENLTGIRVIRAFNAEEFQQKRFDSVNSNLTNTQLFNQKCFALLKFFASQSYKKKMIWASRI